MIDINQINLNIIEWVKRATTKETVRKTRLVAELSFEHVEQLDSIQS
jgi:hypothetical protein